MVIVLLNIEQKIEGMPKKSTSQPLTLVLYNFKGHKRFLIIKKVIP